MLSDDEVIALLTRNGAMRMQYVFLIGNEINIWIPSMEWFVSPRLRDSEVAARCIQYLRDIGRSANSIEAARFSVTQS